MLATMLLVGALAALAPPAAAQDAGAVKLLVLGETHGTRTVTKDLVRVAASKGAQGCVCPGDFIYGHSSATPAAWRDMMAPFLGPRMMPALGNHDYPWSDWSGLFPGGQRYYTKDVNGVQFISVNTEHSLASGSTQRAWLEARLSERDPDALKVLFLHRPWWLPEGARHPSSEFQSKNGASGSTMSALMERHGVDLVVSAHEKNYQHSLVDGVHYLVAGGGTHDFYSMGYSLPGAVKRLQSNVVSTLDVSPSGLLLRSYDRYGGKVEEFRIDAPGTTATPPPPADDAPRLALEPDGGNAWWVQVRVGGEDASRVARVEARDTGGAWVPLTLRSWGAWAASFHVEPGHRVTYRATLDDGRVATTCEHAHPGGGCASTEPPPPDVRFTPRNGNEWWVQVRVEGAQVTGVEARDTGGAWVPLTLRSWGDWAASFHVEPGHDVQYRARLPDGRLVESAWM